MPRRDGCVLREIPCHITQRGVDRSVTFLDADDRHTYLRLLRENLSDAAVRRMLAEQLYLSRFLDYRFRPAAQIDSQQIEDYYRDEFTPQAKSKNQAVPPLEDVEDTIREVLIQRAISDRSVQWLDDTRSRLRIDVVSNGVQP